MHPTADYARMSDEQLNEALQKCRKQKMYAMERGLMAMVDQITIAIESIEFEIHNREWDQMQQAQSRNKKEKKKDTDPINLGEINEPSGDPFKDVYDSKY